MPPNVLLVVFDTARADAFEPYGGGIGSSPAVAQLARRGVALPRAYAPSNWTVPSHVSMLSGLLPRESGLAQAPHGAASCLPVMEALRERLLPEVMKKAGYSTRAVSANAWISKATGFDIGFDTFHEVRSHRRHSLQAGAARERFGRLLESVRARIDSGASAAEQVIRSWLGEEQTKPFFWFVNLVECHAPYFPPRPYNDISLRARLRSGYDVDEYQTLEAVWRACVARRPIPADAMARMRHLYGRSIRAMDDWLGRILEEMDRRGLLDDTIVIATSDHGENLGESNLIGHAFSLDERLIRVPVVIAGPWGFSAERAVGLVELPRLLADALGLAQHPWANQPEGNGVVVSQYDSMGTPDDARVTRVTAEWDLDEEMIARLTSSGTAATDGRLKLVREHGAERLYDLRSDPLEAAPLDPAGATDPALVARLRAALERAEAQVPVVRGTSVSPSEAESADLEERLRRLGYL